MTKSGEMQRRSDFYRDAEFYRCGRGGSNKTPVGLSQFRFRIYHRNPSQMPGVL
jgi:hypothetical protein